MTQGRVEGRMGQIGDSITNSSAYFRNAVLNGPTDNETGHDYAGVRSWLAYSATMPADSNSFYRDHGKEAVYGNASRWTLADAQAADHPDVAVTVGDGVMPGEFSWALIMVGTKHRRGHLGFGDMGGGVRRVHPGVHRSGSHSGAEHHSAGAGPRRRRTGRSRQHRDPYSGRSDERPLCGFL